MKVIEEKEGTFVVAEIHWDESYIATIGGEKVDGEYRPYCWFCRKSTPTMLRLKEIDDGWGDEYICSNCIYRINRAINLSKIQCDWR